MTNTNNIDNITNTITTITNNSIYAHKHYTPKTRGWKQSSKAPLLQFCITWVRFYTDIMTNTTVHFTTHNYTYVSYLQ